MTTNSPNFEKFLDVVNDKAVRSMLLSKQGFEIYRTLDNELFLRHGSKPASLGIVSARAKEGRTSIALVFAALSAAYAPQRRVLLVDATLGGGGPDRLLGIPPRQPGLQEYCYAEAALADCVVHTPLGNLDVMGEGAGTGGLRKLHQARFEQLLEDAAGTYGLIVVDTPAGSDNRDVISLGRLLDWVTVVVRYGFATREQILPLVQEFKRNEIDVLGGIMNQRIYSIPRFLYGK